MGRSKRKNNHSESQDLIPFLGPLQAIQNLLFKYNNRGVVIGGVAASLLGTPRFTADLDAVFLLSFEDIPLFLSEALNQGIKPRITDPIRFAKKSRVLLLRHEASYIDIDISLGVLPFEIEMVQRSKAVIVGPLQLQIPTPEDLIIMKAVAHRSKDLEDIEAIAANHPGMDKERIRNWVEQFGEALDLPDLWAMISKHL